MVKHREQKKKRKKRNTQTVYKRMKRKLTNERARIIDLHFRFEVDPFSWWKTKGEKKWPVKKKRFEANMQGARMYSIPGRKSNTIRKRMKREKKRLRGLSVQFYSGWFHQKIFSALFFLSLTLILFHSTAIIGIVVVVVACCCVYVHVSQLKAFFRHFIIYRFVVRVGKIFFSFFFFFRHHFTSFALFFMDYDMVNVLYIYTYIISV